MRRLSDIQKHVLFIGILLVMLCHFAFTHNGLSTLVHHRYGEHSTENYLDHMLQHHTQETQHAHGHHQSHDEHPQDSHHLSHAEHPDWYQTTWKNAFSDEINQDLALLHTLCQPSITERHFKVQHSTAHIERPPPLHQRHQIIQTTVLLI